MNENNFTIECEIVMLNPKVGSVIDLYKPYLIEFDVKRNNIIRFVSIAVMGEEDNAYYPRFHTWRYVEDMRI